MTTGRKLVVGTFLTLDGVMQAPGGPDEDRDGGFEHGGWSVPYFDDKMGEVMVEWVGGAGGFLLGRRTYEIFAAAWPRMDDPSDPLATALNTRPKWVASKTLRSADWQDSTVLTGDIVEEVRRLKADSGGEIQVHGSCGLIQTLLRHDLIDEMRLWIYPLVLGSGKRLFGAGTVPASLRLTSTVFATTGVVLHVCERAGTPEYGSFSPDDAGNEGHRGPETWRASAR
jgi:dihydrofolate reductase